MRVLLFTGKGGVGKTTVAAATGVRAARGGHRTLVMSTDPAHSLADSFDVDVGSQPTQIEAGLWAQQLDAQERLEDNWREIQDYMVQLMNWAGTETIQAEELTVLPGLDEIFSLIDVKTHVESGAYDVVVVDCAPTAETLRLLSLPEIMSWYIERIFPVERRVVKAVRPIVSRMTTLPIAGDRVFAAVERLRGLGFRCEGNICNVADPASVEAAVARTLEHYGQIDILINNAGVTWGAPAEEMPLDKWREVLDVNLTGAFLVAQATGREMLRRGCGNIINVASVAGLRALPESIHAAAYSAAKGGLIALTRELACKWARRGIRVNAIAPGFFPSRMTERLLKELQPDLERRIPMGRIGRAGELKGVAVFLASEASAYMTGQTLIVDGGATAV